MRSALTSLLLLSMSPLAAQQPLPLRHGQQVVLRGTLTVEPAGRLQFVTVKTDTVYVPMVLGEDHRQHPAEAVHEVGLSGYNRYDLLYQHRGQAVTVKGKMMTDGASPYYFHSTSLSASSIRLAEGTELIGEPRGNTRLAADLGEYRASVLLPSDPAVPWKYSAQGTPDPERRFLSCSSNGGGDVVNCSCAEGFGAIHAESSLKACSAQVFNDSHTAQFGPVDGRRVELSVTCSR